MQRIVVVGTGFAGMWSALAAMRLIDLNGGKATGIEVTVVSPEPTLVMRPRLYEPGAKGMSAPLEELFRATGIQFVKGTVETICTPERLVKIVDQAGVCSTLSYDRLVLAAGSRLRRPNIPGLREHSFSIDQIGEAAEFEAHLHSLAARPPSPARNTVVIGGGGFTGIEIAAELPNRLRSILGQDAEVRVVIIEQATEIGPELGANPRPVIIQALTEQGVETKLGAAVMSVDDKGVVTTSGERIESLTVLWTAGLEATPLTQQIPGAKDKCGRLHVDADLRVPSAREIFVAGDAALAETDDNGHYAMMSCQHAMRLGRFAGHNAAADLLNVAAKPYSQPTYATCLDLGPWGAVVTEGWERTVRFKASVAKPIKEDINRVVIYPPSANRVEAFAAADPDSPGPTLT
ncbi:pyridine nucleotide-disulfide oxidoreductase family protein [Aspergillus bombycis]|uniref:Pyridine nucleotide-disulfide oxidoreductase family protein n=1 Tax=Aspergillus bombycis TaxID=109264 RepID=A0A1F8A0P9_9EURO|nr:pyridine nucleotide-disulfide oxidoreductase family protein [Aspergillus bombycis]OGM45302.1 pyridine nucleotide-disulfide oxidoreductase family protein [Aspergillus bombycis]